MSEFDKGCEVDLSIKHIPSPLGVKGRDSDNKLIREMIGWILGYPLRKGLEKAYPWIEEQVKKSRESCA